MQNYQSSFILKSKLKFMLLKCGHQTRYKHKRKSTKALKLSTRLLSDATDVLVTKTTLKWCV